MNLFSSSFLLLLYKVHLVLKKFVWFYGYIIIFISLQRNKITEGGIQYKNYFWVWEKIVSYEWTSKYTLKLNVKPLLFLIKPIIVIDLWKKKEQKDIVEQFIQEHISANLKSNNYL